MSNLRSVAKAIEHAGQDRVAVSVSGLAADIDAADRLVFPGQGALGECMRRLVERGLDAPLRAFIASGRPFLGICLGLQSLFARSAENGGCAGLGVYAGEVVHFPVPLLEPVTGDPERVDDWAGEFAGRDVVVTTPEGRELEAVAVYESLGGYAPTIGIIGAVLGLIQVLGSLEDPSRLGDGIAVAFVATIYGVGLANLVLLPLAGRLRSAVQEISRYQEMLTEGLTAIAEGENPRVVEYRLLGLAR